MTMNGDSISPAECAWEERIAHAAAAGMPFDDEIRTHVARCERCQAAAFTIRALAEHGRAEELYASDRVPDAEALIALAGVHLPTFPAAPRWSPAMAERVLRPLIWIEWIAIVVATVFFLTIMSWMALDAGAPVQSVSGLLEQNAAAAQADPAAAVMALTALIIVGLAGYALIGLGSVRPAGGLLTRTR